MASSPSFAFKLIQDIHCCRKGLIQIGSAHISTPTALICTSHLLPRHLTPDNLSLTVDPLHAGLEMYAEHLNERPQMWKNCPVSLGEFSGVPEWPLIILTLRDGHYAEASAAGASDEFSELKNLNIFASDNGYRKKSDSVRVFNSTGHTEMAIEDFVDMTMKLKPAVVISPVERYRKQLSDKTKSKVNERSLRLFEKFKEKFDAYLPDTYKPGLIVSIPDGANPDFVAKLVKNEICGFAMCFVFENAFTFGPNSDKKAVFQEENRITPREIRQLRQTIQMLPKDKLLYVRGAFSCKDINILYREFGVDLFDTFYCELLTSKGFALEFKEDPTVMYNVLNLWDRSYEDSKEPLASNCDCISCNNGYMRGYIHHLLHCKEMLAQVLLSSHNLHTYLRSIRNLPTLLHNQ